MTWFHSIKTINKNKHQKLIYMMGGLICIIWLMVTPMGILGKADAIGYAVCHRIDTRSFHIRERQFPLCVRCTGQYMGVVMGLIFLIIFGRKRTGTPPRRVLVGFLLIIVIYAIDGLNSYFYLPPFIQLFPNMPHLYEPTSILRLMSGTGMGLVISLVLYPAFFRIVLVDPRPEPVINDLRTFFILLGISIFVDLFILITPGYVLFPIAILSASGVVVILSMVYTILWIRIMHKENQFTHLSQLASYVAVGFIIAMAQIAFFDLIRYILTRSWNGIFFN
jgi:uncharacterized membrane protein